MPVAHSGPTLQSFATPPPPLLDQESTKKILITHNENPTAVISPSFLLITQQTPFLDLKKPVSGMDGC